ncbi:hypothetical protein CALVIDRAFT_536272 [Calocera viscosa TUFC12733]|uniref:Zn(2)-C6 fungal-type domain-containing protein n=1 Tax=Calocera viscosa (strain TUFC12733) TaxID=1330018 RepID=A0A167N1A9_CALVF|nr:hypothetical protein CALVIDRAFT_536272 [Calocera viscosa TUFC12733]
MAPTPEADDHETAGTAESQTASQPASPASPTRTTTSTAATSPRQQRQQQPPPPPPYPYPPYPGAHPFFGYPPYDPNLPPPPPNPDGSYPPPPIMYGYPPPPGPGGAQHPVGNPGGPPMPMYWHPTWGPPPGTFEGRWMMPPPIPGQEMHWEHPGLRRDDEHASKRRRTGEGGSPEGEGDKRPVKKKIDIACRFCRERKLRCDGARPHCGNCALRERECSYQPGPPNRRGPGKKSKQMAAARESLEANQSLAPISTITSQLPPGPGPSMPASPVQFQMENGKKKKKAN